MHVLETTIKMFAIMSFVSSNQTAMSSYNQSFQTSLRSSVDFPV
jgi:hypothetical protein